MKTFNTKITTITLVMVTAITAALVVSSTKILENKKIKSALTIATSVLAAFMLSLFVAAIYNRLNQAVNPEEKLKSPEEAHTPQKASLLTPEKILEPAVDSDASVVNSLKNEEENREETSKPLQNTNTDDKNLKPIPSYENPVVKWREGRGDVGGSKKSDGWYTREDINNNPFVVFLFGANAGHFHKKAGGGGQAILAADFSYGADFDEKKMQQHGLMFPILSVKSTGFIGGNDSLTIDEWNTINKDCFDTLEEYVTRGGSVVIPCLHDGRTSIGSGIAATKIPNEVTDYIIQRCDQLENTNKKTFVDEKKQNNALAYLIDHIKTTRTFFNSKESNMDIKQYAQHLQQYQETSDTKAQITVDTTTAPSLETGRSLDKTNTNLTETVQADSLAPGSHHSRNPSK